MKCNGVLLCFLLPARADFPLPIAILPNSNPFAVAAFGVAKRILSANLKISGSLGINWSTGEGVLLMSSAKNFCALFIRLRM